MCVMGPGLCGRGVPTGPGVAGPGDTECFMSDATHISITALGFNNPILQQKFLLPVFGWTRLHDIRTGSRSCICLVKQGLMLFNGQRC